MDQYAEIIGKNASTEDYHKIAAHFENCGDHYKAGKFFFASELYDQVSYSLDLNCSRLYTTSFKPIWISHEKNQTSMFKSRGSLWNINVS